MAKKKGLVYTAKNKDLADSVGYARQFHKVSKNRGKTLKLEFDYDDIKRMEKESGGRIVNPELRGAKTVEEYAEILRKKVYKEAEKKGYKLDPIKKIFLDSNINDKASSDYKQLGENTHIFKGDISSKNIVGGVGYKKRGIKDIARYIKNNPGRFGKEAGKVALGAGAVAYGGKKLYETLNKKDED